MIVLDASAAMELVLASAGGRAVARRIGGETVHAPELLLIECTQVLRRLTRDGVVPGDRAEQALDDLLDLDLAYHPHDALVRRIWQLRENLTAYDAAYVALAEALAAPLLTYDLRLAEAPGHHATIEVPDAA